MADTNSTGFRFAFQTPVRLFGRSLFLHEPGIPEYGKGPEARKGELGYYLQFFFPVDHPEAKEFVELVGRARDAKFGKGAQGIALPYQSGNVVAGRWAEKNPGKENPLEVLRGMVLCHASSKQYPPMLSYLKGNTIIDIREDTRATCGSMFYSGGEALVELNLVAYKSSGGTIPSSVKAYPAKVCSLGRGDRIGGASSAQAFASFARNLGAVSNDNPIDEDDELAALATVGYNKAFLPSV